MLNKIALMGRLTKDPELRYTPSQKSVTSFTLAVDRDYQAGTERQTDFVSCVAWNAAAEFVSRNFSKGRMMAIIGRLQSREWTDNDGNKHTVWEVIADNVYFCGDKPRPDSKPVFTDDPDDEEALPF